MSNGFISVAKELFPDALICVDLFHVVQLINKTVTAIRLRLQCDLQDQGDKSRCQMLSKSAKSLLVNEVKADPRRAASQPKRLYRLSNTFEHFPEPAMAYDAFQEFHMLCQLPHIIEKRTVLSDWITRFAFCGVSELEQLAPKLRYWRHYIENTWQYNRSNSTCEGLNNKIKGLKRVCFGLHSFETFRKRVLLTCGPIRLVNDPFTIFAQKREGKGIRL